MTTIPLKQASGTGGALTREQRVADIRARMMGQTPEQIAVRQRALDSSYGTGSSYVPAATLNQQSSVAEIRATTAAVGSPVPLAYGQVQIGGNVFALDYSAGVWTVGVAWCLGEIDAYVKLLINGAEPVSGVTVDYYYGTTVQTVNATLAAKITTANGYPANYADTLVFSTPAGDIGVAYCVIQYTTAHYENWPTFVAEVRGKKVYNPATGLTEYSDNPGLHLGDLGRSPIYGAGWTVDDTGLEDVMDYCDELVSGEKRRTAGVVFDAVQDTDACVEVLRAYASCFVVRRGATVYLRPDKAEASAHTFSSSPADTGALRMVEGSVRIRKKDSADLPTVVRIKYTDTTGTEWREDDRAVAKRPGVEEGTTPWRESVVSMIGVNRYSQAVREAIERLNKLWLADLEVEWEAFDEALKCELADVATLTSFYGLSAKALRLIEPPEQTRPGRWRLRGAEYDPAAYSNALVNAPSSPDANLPSFGPPTAVTSVTLAEDNFQLRSGEYASRIKISWPAHDGPFVTSYQVTARLDGAVVWSTTTRDAEATTPPIKELVEYQIDVQALTPFHVGAARTGYLTVVGKFTQPAGPASVSGYEIAGEVHLAWPKDTSDYDIRRYEIRYGTTATAVDDAIVLDRVDALTYVTTEIPEGTWRFWVNSVDSVEQFGAAWASCDIAVTLNDGAYLVKKEAVTTASTTLMTASDESRPDDVTTYYTDGGDSWSTLFGAVAMNTRTAPVASYQTASGTSEWLSSIFDAGQSYTGDWLAVCAVTHLSGTAPVIELGLSADGTTFTYGGLSQKGTARYARIRVQCAGIFSIKVPGPTIALNVIARERSGSSLSLTSGPKTISVPVTASTFQAIIITPLTSAEVKWAVDNLVTGASPSFDVRIWNAGGALAAVNFLWATRTV